jgi:hypothetical protein
MDIASARFLCCERSFWHVGDAHRRVRLVDVLATGTRGAIGVDAQVRRIDVDLDRVVHFRVHEHRREAGVAARVGVERAFPHQAVDAGFGAQIAVRILAGDLDGGALDARDFAFGLFHQLDGETLSLAVAQIHPLQHAGPVLRLGAAGPRLDFDEAGIGVHRVAEHAAELELVHLAFECRQIAFDCGQGVFVVLGLGQVEELLEIGGQLLDVAQVMHHVFELTLFLAQFLRTRGVVPGGRIFQRAGYFLEF